MKRSVELFVEETNKRGGINGRKIESIIYDAGSESTKAVLAARRLIEQDQVEVIVGDGNRSDIGLALIPTVQRAEVPLMSVSGATGLVEPVRDRAWVFKSTVNDTEVVARLPRFLQEAQHQGRGHAERHRRVRGQRARPARAQAPAAGINVIYEEFGPADTDLTTQLTRIRGTSAQAIICWTVTPAGVVFLKNAQQLGLKQMLVHGFGFVADRYMQLAGDAARGSSSPRSSFPSPSSCPTAIPSRPPSSTTRHAIAPSSTRRPMSTAARRGTASAWSRRPSPAGGQRAGQDSRGPRGAYPWLPGRGRHLQLLAAEALGAREERRGDHRVAPGQVPSGGPVATHPRARG
jgi:hypothetical protein